MGKIKVSELLTFMTVHVQSVMHGQALRLDVDRLHCSILDGYVI